MIRSDKQVPIRCAVGNFKAVDGGFKVEALVLDTPKVNITGSGDVNFTDESLYLRLVSQGKGFSLASLRGAIAITGSFKIPLVRPEVGGALARGGLAVALGAVTAGIGALIPLLDVGKDKNNNCTALMSQAKSDAGVKASDMAPRVGKLIGPRSRFQSKKLTNNLIVGTSVSQIQPVHLSAWGPGHNYASALWIVVFGGIAAICIVAAWLGLMVALAMWAISLGLPSIAAVIAVTVINLIAGGVLIYLCIGMSRNLALTVLVDGKARAP